MLSVTLLIELMSRVAIQVNYAEDHYVECHGASLAFRTKELLKSNQSFVKKTMGLPE
jgi:hypothetical protein